MAENTQQLIIIIIIYLAINFSFIVVYWKDIKLLPKFRRMLEILSIALIGLFLAGFYMCKSISRFEE